MTQQHWRVLGVGLWFMLGALPGALAEDLGAAPIAAPAPVATPAPAPLATPAQAAPKGVKPELYVPPLTANGVEPTVAASLSELLTLELEQTRLFRVKSASEIRALLQRAELKQLLGDESDAELLAATKSLNGGDFLVSGSIGRVGKTYVLTLALIDIKNAKVTRRVKQTLSGDKEGLIGSMHAAVVALALEEKGVAPDITEKLVDGLMIDKKDKTFFLKFMLGYETPVGPRVDKDTIAYIMPNLLSLNVNAAWQALPFMQLQFETGIAASIAADYAMQNKSSQILYDAADAKKALLTTRVQTTQFDFQTERVPVNVMLRFAPKSGRLLPYFTAGLGFSWQRYSLGDNHQEDETNYRTSGGAAIPACGSGYDTSTDAKGGTTCYRNWSLKATNKTVDLYNLQVPAAVGIDYLVSQHFGVGFEVRYTLTYALNKSDSDLQELFTKSSATELLADITSIRRLHHGIGVFAGVFYYY